MIRKIKILLTHIVIKIRYYSIKRKNIILGKNVKFNKTPLIQVKKNAKLIIGNNVTINSNNKGYHFRLDRFEKFCCRTCDNKGSSDQYLMIF